MIRKKRGFKQWLLAPFDYSQGGHQPDLVLLSVVGLLLFFGLLFLSSASASLAFYQHEQSIYYFVKQQIFNGVIPGLILFYLALRTNYQKYQKYYVWFLLSSIVLLIAVFVPALKPGYGTASSWISLGSLNLQTSEVVKLLFILFLAGWLTRLGVRLKTWRQGALPFIIILTIISSLIILQPDLGTLSIIVLTSLAMYFAAGANWKHLGVIVSLGAVGLVGVILAAPYRIQRLMSFMNPDLDPQKTGYQIRQALIAVGSGGWLGLGLGHSRQKFNYLPEAAGDSIFAIIAEEVGFIFSVALIILFVILMLRGFKIVREAPDDFGKLIALGIIIWLSTQVFINIAAIIGLMPLTGVPLPFISLGGSNLVMTLISIGILANISKYTINK